VAQSLIGAFAGFAVLWALGNVGAMIFKQPAMGGGDIKLLGGIGAVLGWKGIFVSLFAASIGGAVFSLVGIILNRLKPRAYIPFGPFLSGGAILALVLRLFFWKILLTTGGTENRLLSEITQQISTNAEC
jgi:leader peptidase (prepilin peptidase)/N-methyltransferase